MPDKAQAAIAPRKRVAKGPRRPQYLANPELDKFMMMMAAMLGEISALRDRMDTYEALTAQGRPLVVEEVEQFKPSEEGQQLREERRGAMLSRVFRVLLEELEEARTALSTKDLEEVLVEDGLELPEAERQGT